MDFQNIFYDNLLTAPRDSYIIEWTEVCPVTMGERIKALRESRGWTQEQLADKVGKSYSAVGLWEKDKNYPRMGVVEKLARAFGVSKGYLVDGEDDAAPAPAGLIARRNIQMRRVPILGDTAAGEPIIANRVYDEYVEVPDDGKRYDAALRVTGDSMTPKYHKGDLAFIRYQEDVEDGQIAAVCLDDEVTLKRVYHIPGGLQLLSDNRDYAPMTITADNYNNVHLVGLAVGVLHWDY